MRRHSRLEGQRVFFRLPALTFAVFILMFFPFAQLRAKPVNSAQAEKAVRGWLKADARPFGMDFGPKIKKTEVFRDADGQPVYYIVHFDPIGFVIVSADDLVEPIVGFVRGDKYDPSPSNPLGALVSRDLPGRIKVSRNLEIKLAAGKQKKDLTSNEVVLQDKSSKAKEKWDRFQAYADLTMATSSSVSISDVRVPPLLQSEWGQDVVCGSNNYCYNYYTPSHYPCGCVATAVAQLMRFFQWPTVGIGKQSFFIDVNDNETFQLAYTRGGNGSGGPYNWSQMVLVPGCFTTTAQRQAIGALCYDAGVTAQMDYTEDGSGTWLNDAKAALTSTFKYSNAIIGGDEYSNTNIGAGLDGMINPNLDAGCPTILGINYNGADGHAVVADGYGYSGSTIYHHINMGWDGQDDVWYNLPDIDDPDQAFNNVDACVYNIFTSGSGEIISGRVTDSSGNPINMAAVTAVGPNGTHSVTTNSNGIYAFKNMPSDSSYTISASKQGFSFTDNIVGTDTSYDGENTAGNVWGVDFNSPFQLPTDCNDVAIGDQSGLWDYPMHTSTYNSRTQVIYLASEIGVPGTISGLSLNIAAIPGQMMNNWTIRIKHTSKSSYSTPSFDPAGWTTVYQADDSISTTGWRTFWFTMPFEYNGKNNLLIDFSQHDDLATASGSCSYSTVDGNRSAYASANGYYGDPLNWSDSNSPYVAGINEVPDVQLMICPTPWKFGTYDTQKNKIITVTDINGVTVTFSLTGGGWGQIAYDSNDFGQIMLHNTGVKSVFSIKTASGRKTSVGDVIVDGLLNSISAPAADLRGNITVGGSVAQIQLNDTTVHNHIITIGPPSIPKAGVLMKFDEVNDLCIDSNMPINALMCTQWLDNDANKDYIKAPSIGTLQVKGDTKRGIKGNFEPDLILAGNPANNTALTNASIAGSINGSVWDITGNVKTVYVRGDVNDWDFSTARGDVSSLKVGRVSEPNDTGLHIEGKINSLQAINWHGGVIEANAVNTLNITGNKAAVVNGDFDADFTLIGSKNIADTRKSTLGSAKIAGKITGGTWNITGNVGSIQLGSSQDSPWSCDFSGDVATLKASGYTDVNGIKVAGVLCVDWVSNSLKSLTVTGSIIDANMTLNQPVNPKISALGSLKVTGWINGSRITSVGNIGSITAGGMRNSSCFAGSIAGLTDGNGDGVLDLPSPSGPNSLGSASVNIFSVMGIKTEPYCVINSNIAAHSFNNVTLAYPKCDNNDVPFGLAADFIKKITVKDANAVISYSNLPGPNDIKPDAADFVIRVW